MAATAPAADSHTSNTSSTPRCILFVDCDRFYFAVEAAERPELAANNRPVIIGWDPREAPRGIVTTANDPARALGIHSGMAAAVALRLAPDALFLPPRHDVYARYSARVMAILRDESPLVQQSSIDEAACEWPYGFIEEPPLALRGRILKEAGISVSLGLATSPLVAKMASEAAKREPSHLFVVQPGAEAAFLAPLPIRALVGVGPKAEVRLKAAGIDTIGALAERPLADLVPLFGRSYAAYLSDASRGIDESPLVAERTAKSVSAEHTFAIDTADRHVLWRELRSQADEVASRLRDDALLAAEVAIKLRYANNRAPAQPERRALGGGGPGWQTLTRQMKLPVPTDDAATLAAGAAALMRRHWERTRRVRLIGLRAGHLTPSQTPAQLPLLTSPR